MSNIKEDFHSCGGYIKSQEEILKIKLDLQKLQDSKERQDEEIEEVKEVQKEIKDNQKEEINLIKEVLKTIKDELQGFKTTSLIVKYSALSGALVYLVTQIGLVETIKTFLG